MKNTVSRKPLRLKDYDYSLPGAYYITICSASEDNVFGNIVDGKLIPSLWGSVANDCWNRIPVRWGMVELDRFVVMPNHLHGILMIQDSIESIPALGTIVNWYKASVTKIIRSKERNRSVVWQIGFYDHIVRDQIDLERIREYIDCNPGRWEEDEYFKR